jgi:hypothetical protein
MENNKAFTLTNGGKMSFFYYHRRFLPINHKYRKNINDFLLARGKKDVAPPRLSSEELHDVMLEYGDIVFGFQSGKQKFLGFGLAYKWENEVFSGSFLIGRPIFSDITLTSCI